jgi:hypothetical protein
MLLIACFFCVDVFQSFYLAPAPKLFVSGFLLVSDLDLDACGPLIWMELELGGSLGGSCGSPG